MVTSVVNIFKTTEPISFKFHMQPPRKGVKKVYIFGAGHIKKTAAMPIYIKKWNKCTGVRNANCL